jgi:hypothetical protein
MRACFSRIQVCGSGAADDEEWELEKGLHVVAEGTDGEWAGGVDGFFDGICAAARADVEHGLAPLVGGSVFLHIILKKDQGTAPNPSSGIRGENDDGEY